MKGGLFMEFFVIGLLVLFIIFCIVMAISSSKAKKKVKKELKSKGASLFIALPHTAGLPIPEHTLCQLYSYPDRIEINAKGTQFNLMKSKITDISMTSDMEIQKQYVSSAAGAVGGAMLFGAVGALIGGRVKEKKIKEVHHYLIFTYEKDGSVDYIAFDATASFISAKKFINEFRSSSDGSIKKVDL